MLVAALLIAMLLLSGCTTVGFDFPALCPTVVAYRQTYLAHGGVRLDTQSNGSMLVQMLSDHLVIWDQVRASC
jgi:hypothetical protein